jgi:hypothetical protein
LLAAGRLTDPTGSLRIGIRHASVAAHITAAGRLPQSKRYSTFALSPLT